MNQAGIVAGFVDPGYVLLGTRDGTVRAVPFDAERFVFTGEGITVAERVDMSVTVKMGVSHNGALVYARDAGQRRLVQVGRDGLARDLAVVAHNITDPRLSPDGRSILIRMTRDTTAGVWVYALADRTLSRVASGDQPIWTPDGRRIAYRVWNGGDSSFINLVAADGSSPPESLLSAPRISLGGYAPDGRSLVYQSIHDGKGSLWYAHRDSGFSPRAFLSNASNYQAPSLSPDGRWVAYVSDESGRREVYVRPFPVPGRRWQVSLDGGTEPLWSATGNEIFYRNGDKMMTAAVQVRPEFAVTRRTELFQGQYTAAAEFRQYDVTRDGNSFIMVKQSEGAEVVVVLNWFERLRR